MNTRSPEEMMPQVTKPETSMNNDRGHDVSSISKLLKDFIPNPNKCARCNTDKPENILIHHFANIVAGLDENRHSYLVGTLCKSCADTLTNENAMEKKQHLCEILDLSIGSGGGSMICDLIYFCSEETGFRPQEIAHLLYTFLGHPKDVMKYAQEIAGPWLASSSQVR